MIPQAHLSVSQSVSQSALLLALLAAVVCKLKKLSARHASESSQPPVTGYWRRATAPEATGPPD